MANITGEELFSLIRGLKNISENMKSIIDMSDFRVNNDYSISGYDVNDIREYCDKAKKLILQTVYEPVK